MQDQPVLRVEPTPKRIRAVVNGKTVADSLAVLLLLERGHFPVWYFPREDVWTDLLEPSEKRTHCPHKGDASHWTLVVGGRRVEAAAWSYEEPLETARSIKSHIAFYGDKVDHWFEEDEEVYGHPRDPYHRIDVRPSTREVRAVLDGETVALTRRALFLFETGLATRYYIPPDDVATDLLQPSDKTTTCPYKGQASYFSMRLGDHVAEDVAWAYLEPLPECPRIEGHLAFDPDRLDRLEVEGETAG